MTEKKTSKADFLMRLPLVEFSMMLPLEDMGDGTVIRQDGLKWPEAGVPVVQDDDVIQLAQRLEGEFDLVMDGHLLVRDKQGRITKFKCRNVAVVPAGHGFSVGYEVKKK